MSLMKLVNVELVKTSFVVSSPPEKFRFRHTMSAHYRNCFIIMDMKKLIMNHLRFRFLFSQPRVNCKVKELKLKLALRRKWAQYIA